MLKPYTPTQKDLDYFRELIRILTDGAMCDMLRVGLQYRVDKTAKVFRLEPPNSWHKTPLAMLYHHHNQYILPALGWKVSPEIDWDADPVKEKSDG